MREHIEHFKGCLSEDQVLTGGSDLEHYGTDSCPEFTGKPAVILLPKSYDEVSSVMAYCHQHNLSVVPSGGRTGYSGGATATNSEVVLSLAKLNKILSVDPLGATITCQAGALTEAVQEQAKRIGFFYPVDFASKGSSQIGGNIATNAGGIRVVRYGSTRDWVLGMKVVLASGEMLDLNGALVKNRSGYDLHQLMIGSEGTLGVVVEATLKLTTAPRESDLVFCAVKELQNGLICLSELRSKSYIVNVFEFLDHTSLSKVLEHMPGAKAPLSGNYPYYVVFEVESRSKIEEDLASMIDRHVLEDVVLAQSQTQARELMSLRESISSSITKPYSAHKNDLSVAVSRVPEFVRKLQALLATLYPHFEVSIFGHLGDGNIHVNILKPKELTLAEFLTTVRASDSKLFELTKSMNGSVSAEHGIGLAKKNALTYARTPKELSIMKQIKQTFDPHSILNPGKIFN